MKDLSLENKDFNACTCAFLSEIGRDFFLCLINVHQEEREQEKPNRHKHVRTEEKCMEIPEFPII